MPYHSKISCWRQNASLLLLVLLAATTKASPIDSTAVYAVYAKTVRQVDNNNNNNNQEIPTCRTPGCVQAATKVMKDLDESVNPCDNFYEFACGSYIKNTPIPSDKVEVDSFSVVRDIVQEQLKTIINEPPFPNESKPFKLAKYFNQACLNQTINEKRGHKPLADLLEAHGGWPVVKRDLWSKENFDWVTMLKKFRTVGLDTSIVFAFGPSTDLKNSSRRVLVIDQTNLGLEREFLIKGLDEKFVKSYHTFMVENAVILGAADKEKAEQELKESLELEIRLANISLPNEERRNASSLYNPTTIKKLQQSYPYLNWLDFFNAMLPRGLVFDENEVVINSVPSFFEKLDKVLHSTSKRAMANYFLWRIILSTSGTQNEQLRDLKLKFYKDVYGLQSKEERWKECISFTADNLGISVGALYVRKYFSEKSKKTAVDMVDDIRNEFINILHNVTWMDNETRTKAIKKAESLTTHIGYPNELADNEKLEEFYDNLEIEPDNILLNTLRLNKFQKDFSFNRLRKPVNKTDWITHSIPATVGAAYSSLENSIKFPAAILQDRFFSADRPRYMNYASIGQVIGHEITHGFDDNGRQFDADGNLDEWWNPKTREQFLEKAKCIIEQYGNYTDPKTNLTVNGYNTQGENIADNGGVKEAYNAYNNWMRRNSPEGTLPGLNYNQQQLFWISSAQMWCSVSTTESKKNKITTGFHSPNEFRVNGVLSNMYEFASDFKCPKRTKMNPAHKCQLW